MARSYKRDKNGRFSSASGGTSAKSSLGKSGAGAPRSRSNKVVGARLDAQDKWGTKRKNPAKMSGPRMGMGGRLKF